MTSHDVVAGLRRTLGIKKIGHAGTLDPMATGLLLVLIGRATRISQYLVGLSKCYRGTMKLGVSTDSHDIEGKVVAVGNAENITVDMIKDMAKNFIGDQLQTPPMFSAKKINGKKLCDLARKGKVVDRDPQFIRVHSLEITDHRGDEIDFFVHCSKGTYVRTLVNDLGERLQCGAHLISLCRTTVGNFTIENALTLEEIEKMSIGEVADKLIPPWEAIPSQIVNQNLSACD
jgi:tRNA pseudouridine55 synthase